MILQKRLLLLCAIIVSAATSAFAAESAGSGSLLLFFGRLHPMVLHMPIGMLLAVFFLELIAVFRKSKTAEESAGYILWVGTFAAIIAAWFGWLLAAQSSYNADILFWHRWLGVGTAVCATVALILKTLSKAKKPQLKKAYYGILFMTLAALTLAGHHGGSLTHGEDYLTKYMPQPFKSWMESKPDALVVVETGPKFFHSAIQPILNAKCIGCHGPSKMEEDLRLDSAEGLAKGSEKGAVIIAGDPAASQLFEALMLPLDDEHAMPPKGKPRLTKKETALIRWWIAEGASFDLLLADAKVPQFVAEEKTPVSVAKTEMRAAPEAKIDALLQIGVSVQPVSRDSKMLRASCTSVAKEITDQQIEMFLALSDHLQEINFANTKITDAGLKKIAALKNLKRLDLRKTPISDVGVAQLKSLSKLEYLNLLNTRVGDAGLRPLANLSNLKNIYLWQTDVTFDGVDNLKRMLPELKVSVGTLKETAANLKSGLIAHFEFDTVTSDSTTIFPAANVQNGEAIFKKGKMKQAFDFNGKVSLQLPEAADFERTEKFSMAAWVYPKSSKPMTVAARMDSAMAMRGWDVSLKDNYLHVQFANKYPESALHLKSKDRLRLNRWNHLALTYTGDSRASGLKLFINGQPQRTEIVQNTLKSSIRTRKPLLIGKGDSKNIFRGRIDDFRIYNRPLSRTEIMVLHRETGGGTSEMPTNLALGAKATSPDGHDQDGGATGDQAAIDGNINTWWDEVDNEKLYRLKIEMKNSQPVNAVNIIGFEQQSFSPKDFQILCDDKIVADVQQQKYNLNEALIYFEEVACKTVELKITGFYGTSPAVREFQIFKLEVPPEPEEYEGASQGTGLIAWYPLDGNAKDATENHEDGIVEKNGAKFVDGKYGKAAQLDGKVAINLGEVANFERTDKFSFGGWVKRQGTNAVIARMDNEKGYRGFDLYFDAGHRASVHIINTWPTNSLKVVAAPIADSEWHHIFATYDGTSKASGAKIYYDGKAQPLFIEQNALTATIRTEVPLKLGSRHSAQTFIGAVDDIRIYDVELSAAEVLTLATTQPEKPQVATAKPVELWKLFDADSCCDKAHKKGAECKHPCCVNARKDAKVCLKCNPGAAGKQ